MLLTIDNVLDKTEVARFRAELDRATWVDGQVTAGTLSRSVKRNEQLDADSELAIALGNHLLRVLGRHPTFLSAALPERIYPPKFNRYRDGGEYGAHVDGAIMRVPSANLTIRSDVSATLFLCEPEEYDGGELEIETPLGMQSIKLPAGAMVLYPSTTLHRVTPVTRGARVCAFFWLQSLIRDAGQRETLYDLDRTIQSLTTELPANDQRLLALTAIYHNLLRRWAET